MVLPCVSKQWARILGRPSVAWEHAHMDLQDIHKRSGEDGSQPELPELTEDLLDGRAISAWFGR